MLVAGEADRPRSTATALRQLADVGPVLAKLSDRAKHLIFGEQPVEVINEVLANPLMHGRVLGVGISRGLTAPDFADASLSFAETVESNESARQAEKLKLLLKLSRLKGVLGRDDVRNLVREVGEEQLAYAWSRRDLWQQLAVPEVAAGLPPEQDAEHARHAVTAAALEKAPSWWAAWIQNAQAPQALVAVACRLHDDSESVQLAA